MSLDRLRDLNLTIYGSVNPLHWRIRLERYPGFAVSVHVGPLSVLVSW